MKSKMGKKNKRHILERILIEILNHSYLILMLSVVLLMYLNLVYIRSPSLGGSYVYGLMIAISFITILSLGYHVLNIRFHKINNLEEFKVFITGLIFIYLGNYVLFGQIIWGFISDTVGLLTSIGPEVVTHIMPFSALILILLYRGSAYFSDLKVQERDYLEDFRKSILGVIMGGIFVSFLVLFFKKSQSSISITLVGVQNIFFIGVLALLIEIWIWLVKVQYKGKVNLKIPNHNISPEENRKQLLESKIVRFITNQSLVKKIVSFCKCHKKILIITFLLSFTILIIFLPMHEVVYETKEMEVNSYYLELSYNESNLFKVVFGDTEQVKWLNRSYPIIQYGDGRIKALTKLEEERFKKGILDYTLLGYLNVKMYKSKWNQSYNVSLNAPEDKVQKKVYDQTNQFFDIVADGNILYLLYDLNITEVCTMSEINLINTLDPTYEESKLYFFDNNTYLDYLAYYEKYHMAPMIQKLAIFSINESNNYLFSEQITEYSILYGNESLEIKGWNHITSFTECKNNANLSDKQT